MFWTPEREEIMRQRYAADGPARLAAEWGTTQVAVVKKGQRMGIGQKRKQPLIKWTDEMIQMLKDRYPGMGCKGLAKELGLSHKTLQIMATNLGLKSNAGHRDWGSRRQVENDSCNIHYFEKWTPNMAYTLGFIFADGTVNRSGTTLAIAIKATDKPVLDAIRGDMNLTREITVRIEKPDPRCKVNNPKAWLHVGSTYLVKTLADLHGLYPNKSHRDDPMPNVPEEFLPHFARGYIDGDGCISRYGQCPKGRWAVSMVGQTLFITQLRDRICAATGLPARAIVRGKGCVTTQWQTARYIERLATWLYPPGDYILMERKRDKFLAALTEITARRMFATSLADRNNVVQEQYDPTELAAQTESSIQRMFATKI